MASCRRKKTKQAPRLQAVEQCRLGLTPRYTLALSIGFLGQNSAWIVKLRDRGLKSRKVLDFFSLNSLSPSLSGAS